MAAKINVAILDDHQPTIDGYRYHLEKAPDISIVAIARTGEKLESLLAQKQVDVLILDLNVPTTEDNPNPYPILHTLPKLLQSYPDLKVLIISMHCQRTLIKIAMEAGAKGFIVKDDYEVLEDLATIVRSTAKGMVHLSQQAQRVYLNKVETVPTLTRRQLEALSLCAAYPDIHMPELAQKLNIAHSTFRNLMTKVYTRLDVQSRPSAVAKARSLGLITPELAPIPLDKIKESDGHHAIL